MHSNFITKAAYIEHVKGRSYLYSNTNYSLNSITFIETSHAILTCIATWQSDIDSITYAWL